jgi:hypothetical protein
MFVSLPTPLKALLDRVRLSLGGLRVPGVLGLILISCLTWTLIQKVAYPALDGRNDMLENYAWSQLATWGTHKHPPFFSWVVGAWFAFVPHKAIYYKLLAYVNVAVALWGVVRLADALKLPELGKPAVILLLWSLPYTTLAAKFNANSQLLSLWPWTVVMLLRAWEATGWRSAFYTLMLGMLAAACMLSKYYSGIFLLGLFIMSVLHPRGQAWLQTPWPYLSLLVFGWVLWPHAQWVWAHDMITFKYVEDQGTGHVYRKGLLTFALSPILYWLPAWLATVFVGARALHRAQPDSRFGLVVWRWAYQSWCSQGRSDTLFWLAFVPWAVTLAFGVTSFVNLSTAWAIPIGYAFPLLWLRNFKVLAEQDHVHVRSPWTAFNPFVYPVLVGMLALAMYLGWHNAQESEANYYRPDRDVANQILADWQQRHPETPLKWVGGDWAENALFSFYGDPALVVIPDLPGSLAASFYDTPDLTSQAGLIFCSLGPVGSGPVVGQTAQVQSPCELHAQAWLEARKLKADPMTYHIGRKGWRFPLRVEFAYVVFHVVPS